MARLPHDHILSGVTGTIGNLVFRSFSSETFVSEKPGKLTAAEKKRRSPLQRHYQDRFCEASVYSKSVMHSEREKAKYELKAKKMGLTNPYTAALTEHLRNIRVTEVNAKRFTGYVGGEVAIRAVKKDFAVMQVKVSVVRGKTVIETGDAVWNNGLWVFRNKTELGDVSDVHLLIEATDVLGRVTRFMYVGDRIIRCFDC